MPYANRVYCGGGSLIPVHCGASMALYRLHFTVWESGGTSAGSIIPTLEQAGYIPSELQDLVNATDFKKLAGDINFPLWLQWHVRKRWGLFKGDRFEKWMDSLLAEKHVNVFSDLPNLKIVATDLTNRRAIIYSAKTHPGMRISAAVRRSSGIPYIFVPKRDNGNVIVDGGLLQNLPIRLFEDSKYPTIAIRMVSNKAAKPCEIRTELEYAVSFMDTMMAAAEQEHIADATNASIIIVNTGNISPIDFGISDEKKRWLYSQGYDAVMDWYENIYHVNEREKVK